MDFLSPDFLSLLTGSATGFLFKAMAERRQQDHERFQMAMGKAEKENEHADAAVQRVGIDAGKFVRRFIVLCIMFGTIIAPFIIAYSDGITTVVEHEATVYKSWDLLKLFPAENVRTYTPVEGYLYTEENRQILVTIVGFYFGTAVRGK
jgi:hypothetical protein|tara:strand:- start:2504 stop:2950 length:447 start_codon:yes stop_codon:yes gene_type:complete